MLLYPPLNKTQRDKAGTAVLKYTVPRPRYVLFWGRGGVSDSIIVDL
jgi:hypothetical protein